MEWVRIFRWTLPAFLLAFSVNLYSQNNKEVLNDVVEFEMPGRPEIQSMEGFTGYSFNDSLAGMLAMYKKFMEPGLAYPTESELKEFFEGLRSSLKGPGFKEIRVKDTIVQGAQGQVMVLEETTTAIDGVPQVWSWMYFAAGDYVYAFLFVVPMNEISAYAGKRRDFFSSIRILKNPDELEQESKNEFRPAMEKGKLSSYERGKRLGYGIGMLLGVGALVYLFFRMRAKNK